MRLVDADQMVVDESEAYMSAQVQITEDLKRLINFAAHSKIQRLIADTPTVDAVPVVRCRGCANFRQGGNGTCWCEEYGGLVTPEDYCSRARMEERTVLKSDEAIQKQRKARLFDELEDE